MRSLCQRCSEPRPLNLNREHRKISDIIKDTTCPHTVKINRTMRRKLGVEDNTYYAPNDIPSLAFSTKRPGIDRMANNSKIDKQDIHHELRRRQMHFNRWDYKIIVSLSLSDDNRIRRT